MSGPDKDPQFLQAALAYVANAWPQLYAAALAFVVALVRSLHSGTKRKKSWMEAVLCGCLTLAVFPVLQYLGLPVSLAAAIGAVIAFKGTEWVGHRSDELYQKLVGRWLK
ncbi:phage holin, lambda family [Halomonas sp. M5N1S17]|uniref:phage holin, lambda family n=1 Tax=Halomonas alkalisoli TaxID=2907158 RepID=UPI001F1DF804|nr:phage holin, lambda family [Halomonas alkalisoli]MCE9664510.1 phage holin, lambda family [Halomonas alkalisoli]